MLYSCQFYVYGSTKTPILRTLNAIITTPTTHGGTDDNDDDDDGGGGQINSKKNKS